MLQVGPVESSQLHVRRTRHPRSPWQSCARCRQPFELDVDFLVVDGTAWHVDCFLCAQCMEPIQNRTYYNVDGRMYCEHDFKTLYAPICAQCGEFVIGHVVKSLNSSFHAHCFKCQQCEGSLEGGVYVVDARVVCYECNQLADRQPTTFCKKCKLPVDGSELLRLDDDVFHASHFTCTQCKKILTKDARQLKDALLCSRCFEMQCEVCTDCRQVIDPLSERSIVALRRHWHLHHFRCSACGRPFNGDPHYEHNNKAYCKHDYIQQFGDTCYYCNKPLIGTNIRLFGKSFCANCYRCLGCDRILHHKDKVMELDRRPLCKKCMDRKEFRKSLQYKQS